MISEKSTLMDRQAQVRRKIKQEESGTKPAPKNYYFGPVQEQAILDYIKSQDKIERNKIYEKVIGPALSELVDKIVYTYRFNVSLPNIDTLRQDCKIDLIPILEKYNVERGSKAFSYFSVITKNWFIQRFKKLTTQLLKEVSQEDAQCELDEQHAIRGDVYLTTRESDEFWIFLEKELDDWIDDATRESEKLVLAAIKLLISQKESIEIINKKAIFIYVKEITGLNSKQIASELSKIKEKYRSFRSDWTEDQI